MFDKNGKMEQNQISRYLHFGGRTRDQYGMSYLIPNHFIHTVYIRVGVARLYILCTILHVKFVMYISQVIFIDFDQITQVN